MKYIYLAATIVNGIASIVSLIRGEILLANTQIILSVLFMNWYKKEERN